MNNIIIGNGINIQYGGFDYTNKNIIERAIQNVQSNNFASTAYPSEILDWFYLLYQQHKDVINGKFNKHAVFDREKEDLEIYRKSYSKKTKIFDIGFEDYFLIQSLFYRKGGIKGFSIYELNEYLKRFFLESIYNNGKINEIYHSFPLTFKDYLKKYEHVFTTNYDRNLEFATERKDIYFLHGAFHFLEDVYDSNSLRNQLSDRPIDNHKDIKGIEYLFSNAISDSSSYHKEFSANMTSNANSAIDKLCEAYKNNPELHEKIEEWKNANDLFGQRIYETIQLKLKNNSLQYSENIHLEKLSDIQGHVRIVGFSPNNDSHILKKLDNNEKLEKIIYCYFKLDEKKAFQEFFSNKEIEFENVKDFWKGFSNTSA